MRRHRRLLGDPNPGVQERNPWLDPERYRAAAQQGEVNDLIAHRQREWDAFKARQAAAYKPELQAAELRQELTDLQLNVGLLRLELGQLERLCYGLLAGGVALACGVLALVVLALLRRLP